MLPLTILNLMVLGPMVAFQDGSCCVCMNSLAPETIASWVRQEKIGHFAAVPTVLFDLLSSPRIGKEDLESLGKPDIGGAVCSAELQTLYRERFGRGVTVAYGMTEAPTIVTRTDPERIPQFGLCGKAVEQLEIIIINENDEILPTDQEGEICFRPAQAGRFAGVYTPMLGYWNKPQESKNILRNGLYHTGDIGFLNADNELTIRGRRNELIIRGGANVYPAEVERVMAEHPAVSSAAVLGISDDRLGQRVVAVVELEQDAETTVADIYDFCRQRLARYKVPETIKIVTTLPRNAMNKVIKPRLIPMFEFEQI
jgi:acyl-CoA synthetase (AMP-forming)/AMP-acid ligase II